MRSRSRDAWLGVTSAGVRTTKHRAWSAAMVRRAVTWLAKETGKAVLKLTDEDYNSHSLQDLLAEEQRCAGIDDGDAGPWTIDF